MSRSRKKVDSWYYSVKDAMDRQIPKDDPDAEEGETETYNYVGELKTEVEVFLVKETEETKTAPYPLEHVHFEVKCKKPCFTYEGPDITCLKDAAWAALDDHYEIDWHEYFLVRVSPARIYIGIGEGLEFSYDTVQKGITWQGKELLKEYSRWGDEHWKIRPWPGRFTEKNGDVIACIPNTPQTLAALEDFSKRIAFMRERLAEFLAPDMIMQTLANLSKIGLLPEVTETQKIPEAKEGFIDTTATAG